MGEMAEMATARPAGDARSRGRARRRAAYGLTRHALERWSERVSGSSSISAAAELERFLSLGHRRPCPRHWTTTHAEPGTTFVYYAEQSDVCVVLCGRVAVTVLTRALCRQSA